VKVTHAVQTWKRPDVKFGKFKQQYVYCCPICSSVVEPYYYAAFNCIDWSDIGTRIGDRSKPLSENTIKRIEYGLKKYGKQHLVITQKYHGETHKHSSKPAYEALRTQVGEQAHGILSPYMVQTVNGGEDRHRSKSVLDTSFTHTTLQSQGFVTPFITLNEHTKVEPQVRSASEAIQTQATRQTMGLVTPWIIEMNKTGECKPATESTATITAGGINHGMVTVPFIPVARGKSKAHSSLQPLSTQSQMINHGVVTNEAWNSFISYYYGVHQASGINEAIGSATTKDRHQLISYKEPQIEDCYYRMLKPPEIKLAMAFGTDYKVLGSGKDQVKQLGNAVTPPAMKWLVQQVIKSLQ
jgi:DNA (cytosine-5)-methyltransferase 1